MYVIVVTLLSIVVADYFNQGGQGSVGVRAVADLTAAPAALETSGFSTITR